MVKLHGENGQIEEHDSLLSVVKAHPEIEEVCLIYRWTGNEASVEHDDVWFDYEFEKLDLEYSFIGSSEGLEHFADNISVWDCESIGLREGMLYGQAVGYTDTPDGYKESDLPPCTIQPGYRITSDCVRLTSVTLPSGKKITIPKE